MKTKFVAIGALVLVTAAACGSSSGSEDAKGTGGRSATGGSLAGAGGSGSETGGSADLGGAGGQAVSDGTDEIGAPCAEVGELSCAGTFQKRGLACGESGTWQLNVTCSGSDICDTSAGANRGTCQQPMPECEDKEPGDRWCDDRTLRECGVDTLDAPVVEECPDGCQNGACDACVETDVDCSGECAAASAVECQEPPEECAANVNVSDAALPVVVRISSSEETCPFSESCATKAFSVFLPHSGGALGDETYRVTVGAGWSMFLVERDVEDPLITPCDDKPTAQCIIVPPTAKDFHWAVVVPDSAASPARNVLVEEVAADATCAM